MVRSKRAKEADSDRAYSGPERVVLQQAASILGIQLEDLTSTARISNSQSTDEATESQGSRRATVEDTNQVRSHPTGNRDVTPFSAAAFPASDVTSFDLASIFSPDDLNFSLSYGPNSTTLPIAASFESDRESIPPVVTAGSHQPVFTAPGTDPLGTNLDPAFGIHTNLTTDTYADYDHTASHPDPHWAMAFPADEGDLPSSFAETGIQYPQYQQYPPKETRTLLDNKMSSMTPSSAERAPHSQGAIVNHIRHSSAASSSHGSADDNTKMDGDHSRRKPRTSSAGSKSSSENSRRGPFRDLQKRLETGQTRKSGACIRCRYQKIRCIPDQSDPQGSCLTCLGRNTQTMSRLPCLRYKITDTSMYSKEDHPHFYWTRRWTSMKVEDITDWESPEVKTIEVTPDKGGSIFRLKVREFIPVEGDTLYRKWVSKGVKKTYDCPPYAIEDMRQAGIDLQRTIDENVASIVESEIDDTDTLFWNTYSMAFRYSHFAEREEERRLLRYVLRLWVAIRIKLVGKRICGQETLGMTPQMEDKNCSNFGKIPLPPVMGAQFELITTAMVLAPLKRSVLEQLHVLIHENKRSNWFTIYLSLFILLHSVSLVTLDEIRYATKHGKEFRLSDDPHVEEIHVGAQIMLAYFHYCNKGSQPFALDWTSAENIAAAKLNAEQVQFMRETIEQIKKRSADFERARVGGLSEQDSYFISQLFDLDWKPSPPT